MRTQQPRLPRLAPLLLTAAITATAAVAAGCTPAPTTPPATTVRTVPPGPANTSTTAITNDAEDDADVAEAIRVVDRFVELWWYGEPADFGELAAVTTDLTTTELGGYLAAAEEISISKLDPNVHVITATATERLEPDLIVVRLDHRDVGTVATERIFFDVVNVDGRWLIAASESR